MSDTGCGYKDSNLPLLVHLLTVELIEAKKRLAAARVPGEPEFMCAEELDSVSRIEHCLSLLGVKK